MRLTQKYGSGVANLLIKDYLPESANSVGNWTGVTFNHALDMATGNYGQSGFMVDENSLSMSLNFLAVESYTTKITTALSYAHRSAPGTLWVYRTADTFLLTRAMQNYLRSRTDGMADIFHLVRDEVYAPLKLSAGAMTTLRTDNSSIGQSFGGYGLFFTSDDVAKLARLLNNEGGRIGGAQVLHPSLLADSLQKNPAGSGHEHVRPVCL